MNVTSYNQTGGITAGVVNGVVQQPGEQKLVVVVMGQNCEKFISMCLDGVKEADAIIYCDGGSTDETLKIVYEKYETEFNAGVEDCHVIENLYDQEDKEMNGKQRNYYLSYVKRRYPDYWCLVLDADEVVEDLKKIKDKIQSLPEGLFSVHMRHFHNDLGHEDATQEKHWVINRLFKISKADKYPEVEHPVLQHKENINGNMGWVTDCTTIWHLAHINHCFNIKGRYEKNMKHSNMHTPEFLDNWKEAHLFGTYPNKPVNPVDIPEVILKYFHVDKDKFYFANRGIEMKHFIDTFKYMVHFKLGWLKNVNVDAGVKS